MPDRDVSDWPADVAEAVRRAAPQEPTTRDVELMASRAWRLAASRKRVEWLRAPGLLGSVVAVAIGVAAIAGALSSRPTQVASVDDVPELAGALKFEGGGVRRMPVAEAAARLSYEPTLLTETSETGRLQGAVLTVLATDEQAHDGDLVLGLDYTNVHFAQYEWDSTVAAQASIEQFIADPTDARLYRPETIGTHNGYAKDPINTADMTDGDGPQARGLVSHGSQVIWTDGPRLYSLSSDSLDSAQLLAIAHSLYR